MSNATRSTTNQAKSASLTQLNYTEIVEYLDTHWSPEKRRALDAIQALDKALGMPSKHVSSIKIVGTNGKGLTANFSSSLLEHEGFKVGSFYSPHILTYNEKFMINGQTISNKIFTEVANEVISCAQINDISASTADLLAAMALQYFKQQHVDVAILELFEGAYDPLAICEPKILAVTRITDNIIPSNTQSCTDIIQELLVKLPAEAHVVSADQNKANLQAMQTTAKEKNAHWAMPIRKLASLNYPFEQLHGRCAALAERIAELYIEHFSNKQEIKHAQSLLVKEKGQRGRPTIEAKRHAELNPKKTLEQFWKETSAYLPGRFQLLPKEKPTILLDTARNVDALKNLLLGIRLLHYQRPLKGIAFILGCDKNNMDTEEFLRLIRYFTKKNSAHVTLCPISKSVPGVFEESWNVDQITNDVKSLKIKARAAYSFKEAFEISKQMVDECNGIIVITGSESIVSEYWAYRDIKKL